MEIVRRGATPQNLLRVLVLVAKTASAHHCGVALHAHAVSHKLEEAAITMDQVREIAATEPRPLSLRQMRTFADAGAKVRLMSAQFLHQELQSRFARAIMELSDLPLGLSNTAAVQQAIGVYRQELHWINTTKPPTTISEDRQFTENLRQAKLRGSNLVPLICYALQQLKAKDLDFGALQLESVQEDITDRLDKFFMGRIGIRMLVGHYVESLEQPGGRVHRVNVEQIVREVCDRAQRLCVEYCGEAPRVEIHVTPSADMPFMYVKSHLHHMVFELVKNSMRATVEHHRSRAKPSRKQVKGVVERVMNPKSPSLGFFLPAVQDVAGVKIFRDACELPADGELPPVKVVICQGKEDLTVRVTDQGGGIPRSRWNKLWHYDYTTSALYPPVDPEKYPTYREQFSGGGYGLPMARLFARYFGGDIALSSQEGVGTTGFIHAHRLGTNTESVVPLRRRMQAVADWEADRLAA